MEKLLIAYSKQKTYKFRIIFHKSVRTEDQQIEPDFYLKWSLSQKVYDGVHYEMEIVSTELTDNVYFEKVHIHTSLKTGKQYICWTGHVPTESTALMVTKMWCAGSVYTTDTGEDFGLLFEKHKVDIMDFEKMIEVLKNEYKILI